jgi:hypothetical protein
MGDSSRIPIMMQQAFAPTFMHGKPINQSLSASSNWMNELF